MLMITITNKNEQIYSVINLHKVVKAYKYHKVSRYLTLPKTLWFNLIIKFLLEYNIIVEILGAEFSVPQFSTPLPPTMSYF